MANEKAPSADEEAWKASLDDLKKQMVVYEGVSKGGDDRETEAAAHAVSASMRKVGDSHTDPKVKKEWHEKAEKFSKARSSERARLFEDIGKGLLILLATPFALAAGAIFAAGAIVYGAGLLVKGLGNVMTFGLFSDSGSDSKAKDS